MDIRTDRESQGVGMRKSPVPFAIALTVGEG